VSFSYSTEDSLNQLNRV